MKRYRAIVFFDLDGTFLDNHKNIPKNNLKAVQLLKKKHILPVICTGRNIVLVRDIMKKSGITTVICGNGNYIVHDKHPIYKSIISDNTIKELVALTAQFKDPLTFQTPHHIAVTFSNKLTRKEYRIRHHTSPQIDPNFYLRHHLIGCNIFTLNKDKVYQKVFLTRLSIVRNSNLCLDVQNKNINKGYGVYMLLKKMHLMSVPTYAFGDGRNDAPLLKSVNHGIAMANGWDFIRYLGDYVTSSNENNGIVKGLKHYKLL